MLNSMDERVETFIGIIYRLILPELNRLKSSLPMDERDNRLYTERCRKIRNVQDAERVVDELRATCEFRPTAAKFEEIISRVLNVDEDIERLGPAQREMYRIVRAPDALPPSHQIEGTTTGVTRNEQKVGEMREKIRVLAERTGMEPKPLDDARREAELARNRRRAEREFPRAKRLEVEEELRRIREKVNIKVATSEELEVELNGVS